LQTVEDVKELLGYNKNISDDQIKEAINRYDYDVDRACDYLLKQLEKDQKEKEKAEEASRISQEQVQAKRLKQDQGKYLSLTVDWELWSMLFREVV
jgi:hypothetical protein